MKKIVALCSFVLFLNLIYVKAQNTGIFDFGTPGNENKGRDGIIDNVGNFVFSHTDGSNNNFTVTSVSATYQTNWVLNFIIDGAGPSRVEQLSDGNYLVTVPGMYIASIIKISPSGIVLFYRAYHLMTIENFLEDTDHSLYFTGEFAGFSFLGKMDTLGDFDWLIKNSRMFLYRGMIFTNDGNIAVAGSSQDFNPDFKFTLSKFTKNGVELWSKEYSSTQSIYANWLMQGERDSCYYFSGTTMPANSPDQADLLYGKFDPSGNFIGARRLSAPYEDDGWGMIKTEGGNYEFIAWSRPNGTCGGSNMVFVKFDSNLDTIVTKRYGEPVGLNMMFYYLKRRNTNEVYIYGSAVLWSHIGIGDVILMKTDTAFNLSCNQLPNVMTLDTMTFTSIDTSNISLDSTNMYTTYNVSTYGMLTADGCTGTMLTDVNSIRKEEMEFNIFPNPTSGIIRINATLSSNAELRIYDAFGKLIMHTGVNSSEMLLDLSFLNDGLYHCVLSDGEKCYSKKMLLMH